MKNLILVVFALIAFGCGRYEPAPDPYVPVPTPPGPCPAPTQKVIVAVFGAPWCSACKTQIPKLDGALKKLPADVLARVEFRFYVTTGSNSAVAPTQAEATAYRNSLHLSAQAMIDPWRWTNFKKWVGGALAIPGAAVLSGDEKLIRSFRGGVSFDISDIVETARKSLKP